MTARPSSRAGASRFAIDAEGMARGAAQIPSPNWDARPAGAAISLIVVHGISLPPGKFGGDDVARLFTNALDADADPFYEGIAHLRVSAHFFIRRDGALVQFVGCARRAWHAGVSSWRGRPGCNDYSVGIELEGADEVRYAPAQYRTLAQLARTLRGRYPIRDMVGHSDVAPGRKTDPGPAFDWPRLGRMLGVAPTAGTAGGGR